MGFLPMGADILPPSDDRVFKLILTSPEAKQALMALISCIIGRKVVDVTLCPNELAPGDTEEKAERFDVFCKIDDGSQVNLEMQASYIIEDQNGLFLNVKGKYVYYATDLHSSQPAKGLRRYDRLVRTYQITFCAYTIFPNSPSYVNSFSLRNDETGELLTDAISLTFVELSKLDEVLKKPVSEMSGLDKWSVFFRYAPDPRYRELVNEVIESEEVLQVAGNLLMSISKNERERAIYRSRRKYQTDLQSNLATAEDNGIAKGLARGIAKGRTEGLAEGRAEGLAEGLAEGRTEGRAEGRDETMVASIRSLMNNLGLSMEQAMTALNLSQEERLKYKALLNG